MLISCIHVPAPQTSRQQTHGLVGLRSRGLCPDTHVEHKRPGPGATGKLPVEKSTCACVPLCAHGGGWSRAWFDRGALEATALITAAAGVLRGGRNTEKVTSWLVDLGRGGLLQKCGSGWIWVSCTRITLENLRMERSLSSVRLLEGEESHAVRALQGETSGASPAYGVGESTSPSNISAKKFKNE